MHNGLAVHIINALTNLSNEENAVAFSEREIIGDNTLEKLSARDAVEWNLISVLRFFFVFQWNLSQSQTFDREANNSINS